MTSKECLYEILGMLNYEQMDVCEKNNYLKIISQDLDRLEQLEKENKELNRQLDVFFNKLDKTTIRAIDLISYDLQDENTKLRKSIEILKDKFEIVICKNDFPISGINYSIRFKISNDGVWAHITQEDCELLEEVFNYE